MSQNPDLAARLDRIAAALERLAPPPPAPPRFDDADAFVWQAATLSFQPVPAVNRVPLTLLRGIDGAARQLLDNTRRFAEGLPANNALLWGARGMGKSSLVKAAHAEVQAELGAHNGKGKAEGGLKLVEIHREDIATLPAALTALRAAAPHRFIVFCDDLSFDRDDTSYKSLKAVLEGGIEGRPPNVLFYATSNRRHLMPRDMVDNERSTAINPSEAVEEKVSLSDRFGLWLGFHNCSQDEYLAMVEGYAAHFRLPIGRDELVREALEWSLTRGGRSGRVAWQFTQDLAGRLGKTLDAAAGDGGQRTAG
jgi:predicted AAA+ superfamily ATPase